MILPKSVREIIGHTFGKSIANAKLWHELAVSYHEAAKILHVHNKSVEANISVVAHFNGALSLELMLKAILVAKGRTMKFTHKLKGLAKDAEIEISENQKMTLELLSEVLEWRGRYPVPTKEEKWDNYHDNIYEKHKIRTRKGNVGITRSNPETFPNLENYLKIWEICQTTWATLKS
jgi:HEPN domain-containing protein